MIKVSAQINGFHEDEDENHFENNHGDDDDDDDDDDNDDNHDDDDIDEESSHPLVLPIKWCFKAVNTIQEKYREQGGFHLLKNSRMMIL